MIFVLVLFLSIFYLISCVGAIHYLIDRDIEPDILSILIVMCPILNTYLALKADDLKDTIQKLKEGKK
jgi:hypothetical protein